MSMTQDNFVNAVRCKLGISVDGNTNFHMDNWREIYNDPVRRKHLLRVSGFLEKVVRHKMGLCSPAVSGEEAIQFDSLWELVVKWVAENQMKRSPLISKMILEAVGDDRSQVIASPRGGSVPATVRGKQPAFSPNPPQTPRSISAQPPGKSPPTATPQPPKAVVPPSQTPSNAVVPQIPASDSPSPGPQSSLEPSVSNSPSKVSGPQWKYVPVPESEPDPHEEYATQSVRNETDGCRILAARVRGKKHKHEGTNCDDWFEIRTNKHWSLIAVADGAGSRKFSRVGARVSCAAAVKHLAEKFCDQPPFQLWPAQKGAIENEVVNYRNWMVEAVKEAYRAVSIAFSERKDNPEYEVPLASGKRQLEFADLSATLLLAAHSFVKIGSDQYSLVIASQIGDGAVAAIDMNGEVHVLGLAESGEYSGETDFLTSKKHQDDAVLIKKLYHLSPTPIRALLVMTDGVADDYFPAEPGMARLYADLVMNGILKSEMGSAQSLKFDPAKLDWDAEAQTKDGPQQLKLRSAEKLIAELAVTPQQLVAEPALLAAATLGSQLLKFETPEERLRWWLDSYTVRGSFDDRTLVVLQTQKEK